MAPVFSRGPLSEFTSFPSSLGSLGLTGGLGTGMPDSTSMSPESQEQQGGSQAEIQELMLMIRMLIAELQQQEQGGQGHAVNPADNIANDMGGGGGGGGVPSSGGGGVPSSGGGSSGAGSSPSSGRSGSTPTMPATTAPSGSGEKAVQIAQSQYGVQCQNINLPNYNVDGPHTDGCANFVTAVEADAGRYKMTAGDPLVSNFEQDLKQQGWKAVSQQNAQPGDVVIFHNSSGGDQHTEIVDTPGATKLIGNNGTSQEQVGYDQPNWGTPTFYAPGTGG